MGTLLQWLNMRNNSYAHNWEARVSHSKTETRKKMCVSGSFAVNEKISEDQKDFTRMYLLILRLKAKEESVLLWTGSLHHWFHTNKIIDIPVLVQWCMFGMKHDTCKHLEPVSALPCSVKHRWLVSLVLTIGTTPKMAKQRQLKGLLSSCDRVFNLSEPTSQILIYCDYSLYHSGAKL